MLVDIMSGHSYMLVNTKAVQLFGLPLASYWAVLADIYPRVIEKKLNELTTTGYFTLDREYVEKQCGLTSEEQITLDQALIRLGVMQVSPENPNLVGLSMQAMAEALLEDDTKVLQQIQKKAKTKKVDAAAAKRSGKISTFCAFAATLSHTPEVQEAYRLWITSCVEGGKCAFSKTTVQMFHDTMTGYTQDPQVMVDILHQAAASGYPNASWIINSLNKKGATTPATRINVDQKKFTGINTSEVF